MFRFEDLLVILFVALLLFGPNKMVDFAKGLGSAMREFKKAANPDQAPSQTTTTAALPSEVKPAETKNS